MNSSSNSGLFGSGILDVAIGLALLYLVLSVMASAVNEALAGSLLRLRSQGMEQFIRGLFMRPEEAANFTVGFWKWMTAGFSLKRAHPSKMTDSMKMGEAYSNHFFDGTLIGPINAGQARPSYIAAKDFSLAIFDLLFSQPATPPGTAPDPNIWKVEPKGTTSALPPGTVDMGWRTAPLEDWIEVISQLPKDSSLRPVLLSTLKKANGDIEVFRSSLETWFDDSMERVTGWYKRRTQQILLIIGLTIAILLNVDTIAIANRLLQNPAIRALVADQGVVVANNAVSTASTATVANTAESLVALRGLLSDLNIPLGWTGDTLASFEGKSPIEIGSLALIKIVGILITGFAVSQGAPFWFDLLNKLTNLRSSGRAPRRSDDKGDAALKVAVQTTPADDSTTTAKPAATSPPAKG